MLTSALEQVFSNFSVCQNDPESSLKYRLLESTPIISEGLRWVLSICISYKFPGCIAAGG